MGLLIPEPAPEAPAAGAAQNVTPQQLTDILEGFFRVTAFGIIASNPAIPQNVLWESIAGAMGNVLSMATRNPDLKSMLEARTRVSDLVTKAIRKRYPAITMQMPDMPKAANGVAGV